MIPQCFRNKGRSFNFAPSNSSLRNGQTSQPHVTIVSVVLSFYRLLQRFITKKTHRRNAPAQKHPMDSHNEPSSLHRDTIIS